MLLLLSQSVVSVERMALLRWGGGAGFAVWAVAGGLLVCRWSSWVCGWVGGRAVGAGSWARPGCPCCSAASPASLGATAARWDGWWTTFVLAGEVLFGQLLLATALLLCLALAVFLFFLQLERKRKVVVFLFA